MSSKTRQLRRAACFAVVTALSTAGRVGAQEWHDFRSARQVNDVGSLQIHLLYAVGRLTLDAADGPLLYDARARYDASRFEPYRNWKQEGDHGQLSLAVSSGPNHGDDARVSLDFDDWDVDFNLEDLPRGDSEQGEFDLRLHRLVPIALKIGAGASKTRLELGDLTLTSVEVATGASDASVRFGSPNRTRMERLSLKTAAAEFRGEGLGNARFDHLEFGALVGDVTLDFDGQWDADATAKIKMGLGELVIRVPTEIGVRINRKSLFTSFSAEEFERDGDAYVTPNWDSASIHLDIELDAGLVSVKIERS